MDEATSLPLHRWLSFLRLLLQFHPRVGARSYARHVQRHLDLRPGWNAIHRPPGAVVPLSYIFIGKEDGLNTDIKPDVPDSEIYHVYERDLPEFATSLARKQMLLLAKALGSSGISGYGPEDLRKHLNNLDEAAAYPLRGPTAAVDARIDRDLDRLRQAIAAGASKTEVMAPLGDVIRDCLSFRLSVTHASNVLSILLVRYLSLPSHDGASFPDRVLACVDYLTERVGALNEGRQAFKLTPFYEATYLGLLYGNTAVLLCRQAQTQLPDGLRQRRLLERRGLYVDEVMAHDLSPCLMHPIDLAPCSPIEYEHARRFGIADAGGIYVGAVGQGAGPVNVTETWVNIERHSADAGDMDITASIDGINTPLSLAEHKRLAMFLVTMALGRGQSGVSG